MRAMTCQNSLSQESSLSLRTLQYLPAQATCERIAFAS